MSAFGSVRQKLHIQWLLIASRMTQFRHSVLLICRVYPGIGSRQLGFSGQQLPSAIQVRAEKPGRESQHFPIR